MNNEIVFAFPVGCLGLGLYEFALVHSDWYSAYRG